MSVRLTDETLAISTALGLNSGQVRNPSTYSEPERIAYQQFGITPGTQEYRNFEAAVSAELRQQAAQTQFPGAFDVPAGAQTNATTAFHAAQPPPPAAPAYTLDFGAQANAGFVTPGREPFSPLLPQYRPQMPLYQPPQSFTPNTLQRTYGNTTPEMAARLAGGNQAGFIGPTFQPPTGPRSLLEANPFQQAPTPAHLQNRPGSFVGPIAPEDADARRNAFRGSLNPAEQRLFDVGLDFRDPNLVEGIKRDGVGANMLSYGDIFSGQGTLDALGINTRNLPGPLQTAIDIGAAPITLGTMGFGAPAAMGLRTLGPVGRGAAAFVEPLGNVGANAFTRMLARGAAETGVGFLGTEGSRLASEGAQALGIDNPILNTAIGLAGGVAAGGAGVGVTRGVARGFGVTPPPIKGVAGDMPPVARRANDDVPLTITRGRDTPLTVTSTDPARLPRIPGGGVHPDDALPVTTLRTADDVPLTGSRAVDDDVPLTVTKQDPNPGRVTVVGKMDEIDPGAPAPRRPAVGVAEHLGPTRGAKGDLLQLDNRLAGTFYSNVKKVLQIARQGDRARDSQANRLHGQVRGLLRSFNLDKDGHHVLDLPGQPSLYDVAENPSVYRLTPDQREAITRLGEITEAIRREREIFGIEPKLLDIEDEGAFLHRKPVATEKGDLKKPRQATSRLGGTPTEESRRYVSVRAAEDDGVKYASVQESMDEHVAKWLKAATDKHVSDLLVPLSETATTRLPPQLKKAFDATVHKVRRLTQFEGSLTARELRALEAALGADDPDIYALMETLAKVRVTRGTYKGTNLAGAKALKKEALAELRKIAPQFRAAQRASRAIPEGRARVNIQAAPTLSARDFTVGDANRLTSHYGRRLPPVGRAAKIQAAVRPANVAVRFTEATLDLSSILRQQASMLATRPDVFSKDLFKSFVDVANTKWYDQWIGTAKAQRAARRGVAIFGEAGELAEFQAGNWMERIPILGHPVKWADNHFARFQTRQRVEMFDVEVKRLSKKFGRPLTAAEEERVALGINRATGVSASIADDLESDMMFAARYTRSTIEEVGKAVSSGEIDGQLARRYIGHLVGASTVIAAAGLLLSGRTSAEDWEEIFNPFTVDDDGNFRLNPNFMSVRISGHDWKPLGTYDSLARLITVGADASSRAIREQDAMELFDFVGYALSTKGSPVVSLISDLFKRDTFDGDHPLEASSLGSRLLPFTIQSFIQNLRDDMSIGDAVGGAIIEGLGGKGSPLSFTEERDEIANEMFGEDFDKLNDGQQDQVTADERVQKMQDKFPEDAGTLEQQTQFAFDQYDEYKGVLEGDLRKKIDAGLSNEALADAIGDFRHERFIASDALFTDEMRAEWEKDPSKHPEDIFGARYWSVPLDEDPATGKLDFDKRDAERAKILAEAKAAGIDTDYITVAKLGNFRNTQYDDPVVAAAIKKYDDEMDVIQNSGVFDNEKGVRDFLENNPKGKEIEGLLRKLGVAKRSITNLDETRQARRFQEEDDAKFSDGQMSGREWRDKRQLRQANLRKFRDGLYADLPPNDTEAKDALDQYYGIIDSAIPDPSTGEVDWDEVDRQVALLPASVQAEIEANTGIGGTAVEQQYRAAVQRIEASEYWDVPDLVAVDMAKERGVEGVTSADDLRRAFEAEVDAELRADEPNMDPKLRREWRDEIVDWALKDYTDIVSDIRAWARESSDELLVDLMDWDYYPNPSKENLFRYDELKRQ